MILIVESESLIALSIKLLLEDAKFNVKLVQYWEAAVELLVNTRPAIIITDYAELINHTNKRSIIHDFLVKRNIPVIFTAFNPIPDDCYDIQVLNVVTKPFSPLELERELKDMLLEVY